MVEGKDSINMYKLILKIRDRRFRRPGYKFFQPDVPSICVGNITVGGTGKTPMIELLIKLLQESEQWRDKQLAVVSLGYKRSSKGFQQVLADSNADAFGDEPLQIKKKFPKVTVVVDKDRVEACKLLCEPSKMAKKRVARKCWHREFPKADFILFDDAFQYRKLKAYKNIVLVDYNRPIFDDTYLPFGYLRDLRERIHDADIVVVTKAPQELEPGERDEFMRKLGVQDKPVFFTYIKYNTPRPAFPETEPRYLYSEKVIMATGIAKDTALRNHLSDNHKVIKRFAFPDHHKFAWGDIQKINAASVKHSTAALMTTEKDLQRFVDFQGLPLHLKERMFVVPIETEFIYDEDRERFVSTVLGELPIN